MKFNLNTSDRLLDIISTIFFSVVLVFVGFSIGHSFHYESNNPTAGKKDTLVFQIQSVIMDTVVIYSWKWNRSMWNLKSMIL